MEPRKINEKKHALIVVLEKINDLYTYEHNPSTYHLHTKANPTMTLAHVGEMIRLNGIRYNVGYLLEHVLRELESSGAIEMYGGMFNVSESQSEFSFRILDINKIKNQINLLNLSGVSLDKINRDIETSKKTTHQDNGDGEKSNDTSKLQNKYEISIKDREIWVNNKYLISKPHSIGSNMEFFLYLIENQNKSINRIDLPEGMKNEIKGKGFSKIVNALGFSGEILKTFFPKRGKGQLLFRKTVSKSDLKLLGVKENLFLKELELAHMKHGSK